MRNTYSLLPMRIRSPCWIALRLTLAPLSSVPLWLSRSASSKTPLATSLIEQCLRDTAASLTTIWLEASLPSESGPSFAGHAVPFK